jgi:hypothetical protein
MIGNKRHWVRHWVHRDRVPTQVIDIMRTMFGAVAVLPFADQRKGSAAFDGARGNVRTYLAAEGEPNQSRRNKPIRGAGHGSRASRKRPRRGRGQFRTQILHCGSAATFRLPDNSALRGSFREKAPPMRGQVRGMRKERALASATKRNPGRGARFPASPAFLRRSLARTWKVSALLEIHFCGRC